MSQKSQMYTEVAVNGEKNNGVSLLANFTYCGKFSQTVANFKFLTVTKFSEYKVKHTTTNN